MLSKTNVVDELDMNSLIRGLFQCADEKVGRCSVVFLEIRLEIFYQFCWTVDAFRENFVTREQPKQQLTEAERLLIILRLGTLTGTLESRFKRYSLP